MKFDWNDVLIEPRYISSIKSRNEIDPCYKQIILPIFVSPMDTVINEKNYHKFIQLGMNVCLTRGIDKYSLARYSDVNYYLNEDNPMCFFSYGLDEFIKNMKMYPSVISKYSLIDIANGNMEKLYETVREFKGKFPHHILMVGNVANPATFRMLSDAGADYIRVGIGNGGGCLTTQQTGIGYPMGSLISECFRIKIAAKCTAKIVADGGFKGYSDIIKALALGADYVMLGSILNKTLESSGDTYWRNIKVNFISEFLYRKGFKLTKKFRGMSTKEVQKKWGRFNLKTSEGVVRRNEVEYTISKWRENFLSYLKSAMSYTDSRKLEEFIGKVRWNIISNEAYKRFNK